jgi:hypothetical protein
MTSSCNLLWNSKEKEYQKKSGSGKMKSANQHVLGYAQERAYPSPSQQEERTGYPRAQGIYRGILQWEKDGSTAGVPIPGCL